MNLLDKSKNGTVVREPLVPKEVTDIFVIKLFIVFPVQRRLQFSVNNRVLDMCVKEYLLSLENVH